MKTVFIKVNAEEATHEAHKAGIIDLSNAVWLKEVSITNLLSSEVTEELMSEIIYEKFKRGSGSYSVNADNAAKAIMKLRNK